MRVVCWNVNSLGARWERVATFVDREKPDVLCFQEIKCIEEKFPTAAFEERGYQCAVLGQRTYNGVAIASRLPMKDVTRGFEDGDSDEQSRLIGATIGGIRLYSVYVPNGQSVGSDKYAYKLAWLARLKKYVAARGNEPLVLAGDFNVAPEDRDVHDPEAWRDQVLCSEPERAALRAVMETTSEDLFRKFTQEPGHYSWWDYRMLAFPKNRGLRIDLFLANQKAAQRATACSIWRAERKGEKPSDHAPIEAVFQD